MSKKTEFVQPTFNERILRASMYSGSGFGDWADDVEAERVALIKDVFTRELESIMQEIMAEEGPEASGAVGAAFNRIIERYK